MVPASPLLHDFRYHPLLHAPTSTLLAAPLLQVFRVTQDLKVVNAPSVVLPAVLAAQAIEIPRPNLYAPVCPPGYYQNPDDYKPCIPCALGKLPSASYFY